MDDAPDWTRPIDVVRRDILCGLLAGFKPGTCVDLACGTGLFAIEAAEMGWTVRALDARERDWPQHPDVTFRRQDVRDADLTGTDLVLCLGIFYHLDLPDQLALLAKCEGIPLILDTHVSADGGTFEGGYEGHWYPEGEGLLAAWKNKRSWWPTVASLEAMLKAHGYQTVTAVEPWYHGADRTFFTCLP